MTFPINPLKALILRPQLSKNSGFTLIEVLVTIAILGVLGAIAIPSYLVQAG